MEVAFKEVVVPLWIKFLIDGLLTLDIVVTTRTTFFHPITGDQIKKPKEIVKYYLTSCGFIVDFLATLPLFQIMNSRSDGDSFVFRAFLVIKLLKLFRVEWDFTHTNSSELFKLLIKLIKLFYFLLVYIHFTACLHYYIANIDQKWRPT